MLLDDSAKLMGEGSYQGGGGADEDDGGVGSKRGVVFEGEARAGGAHSRWTDMQARWAGELIPEICKRRMSWNRTWYAQVQELGGKGEADVCRNIVRE